jgi:hypothetical protein
VPDGIQPVGALAQPPSLQNSLGSLSALYGVKQAQQNLRTGQYAQAATQADSQQAQQKNQELQKAQAVAIQGAQSGAYDDGNGGIDRQKMANDILKVAPVYGQGQVGALLSQANEITSNKRAVQGLTLDRKTEMGNAIGSLAADPNVDNTKVIDTVEKLRAAHPNDPDYSRLLTSQMMHLPNSGDPKVLQDYLGRWSAGMTGTPQVTPGTVATPGGTQGIAQNRFTGAVAPGGAPVAAPPHQTTNAAGQLINVTPGGVASVAPSAGPSAPPGVGANPTTAQASVQNDAARMASESIENARAIGDMAPTSRNVNDQLLKLSSGTSTGPGTATAQKLAAVVGLPSGSSYQEINAYLDRQAALSARQMGVPNTNAGLAAAQSASGTTEYTPKALQEKVKFADSLNSGAIAYRQGLDKAVGTNGAPDVGKYQAFRASWARNFDPDVFRAEDAMRRGDKDELTALKSRLGPQAMAALKEKSANLRQLENGQIPP